ncbi:hypothetical protein MUP32_02405, partial [Candidatus Microgenomates bacterium]|nr:hypothetical protein [Candidatus Microgenomates bacterium]
MKIRLPSRSSFFLFFFSLSLLSSLLLYLSYVKPVYAATLSLSTTESTIQIDVPNRYRAILNSYTNDTDDFLAYYDRAQNDSSPALTFITIYDGGYFFDENVAYKFGYDPRRKWTILESTATRVRVRVEGCYSTSADVCLADSSSNPVKVAVTYTFTTEGVFISTDTDFGTGVSIDATTYNDDFWPFNLQFNQGTADMYSETVLFGNGVTESQRTGADGDGNLLSGLDGYYVLQGSGSYQDVIFGKTKLMGDRYFSNAAAGNGTDWYDIDNNVEKDWIAFLDYRTQTLVGKGSFEMFMLFKPQTDLDSEAKRESVFNDITNPDILTYTTGTNWDDKPFGYPIFASSFGGGDSNLCDGGDGWESGYCGSGNTAVGNESTTVYSPTYGAKFTTATTATTAKAYKTFGRAYSTIYARMYFNLTQENLANYDSVTLMIFRDTIAWQMRYLSIYQDGSGNLQLMIGDTNGTNTLSGTNYIKLNTWYSLEFAVYRHATAGTMDAWLNGLNVIHATGQDTGDNDIDYLDVGLNWGPTVAHQMYVDNVIVSDSYIGLATFNEAEGTYTANVSSNQIEVDIDGDDNASNVLASAAVAGENHVHLTSSTGFPDGADVTTHVAFIEGDKFSYNDVNGNDLEGIPTSGELSIISHASGTVVSSMNRHDPFFKIKNYRSNTEPDPLTLEGVYLADGTDYNLDYKPVTSAYWAQDLTWHSTLESSGAVTSPDVGSAGTVSGATFTTGKYGNGILFDATGEYASFPLSGNVGSQTGSIEFWYKKTGTVVAYSGFFDSSGGSDLFVLCRGLSDSQMIMDI